MTRFQPNFASTCSHFDRCYEDVFNFSLHVAISQPEFMSRDIEQYCYLPKTYLFYLLDSSSTSSNHILVELFENWNLHTEIGSNLHIAKKDI